MIFTFVLYDRKLFCFAKKLSVNHTKKVNIQKCLHGKVMLEDMDVFFKINKNIKYNIHISHSRDFYIDMRFWYTFLDIII